MFDFFVAIFFKFFPLGICLRKQRWGICITYSPKRRTSEVFAEFHEFLSSPEKLLDRSFRICPLKICFFRRQNQLSFYFFWNKKLICRKKCLFSQNFMSFCRPPKFFWGNIFKYVKKKMRFSQKMWKKLVCVSFQKSAIFAAIWGQIKN